MVKIESSSLVKDMRERFGVNLGGGHIIGYLTCLDERTERIFELTEKRFRDKGNVVVKNSPAKSLFLFPYSERNGLTFFRKETFYGLTISVLHSTINVHIPGHYRDAENLALAYEGATFNEWTIRKEYLDQDDDIFLD